MPHAVVALDDKWEANLSRRLASPGIFGLRDRAAVDLAQCEGMERAGWALDQIDAGLQPRDWTGAPPR